MASPTVPRALPGAKLKAVLAATALLTWRLRHSWWRRLFGAGAVVVAVMGVSTEARADFENGNSLYAKCASSNPIDWGICFGYITATADAERRRSLLPSATGINGTLVCPPEDATAQQLVDVVKQYLANHPEDRHYAAASLAPLALSEAFPCK